MPTELVVFFSSRQQNKTDVTAACRVWRSSLVLNFMDCDVRKFCLFLAGSGNAQNTGSVWRDQKLHPSIFLPWFSTAAVKSFRVSLTWFSKGLWQYFTHYISIIFAMALFPSSSRYESARRFGSCLYLRVQVIPYWHIRAIYTYIEQRIVSKAMLI
jgi:hypothetical protein